MNEFNLSYPTTNYTHLCEVNQYNALQSVQKFPKIAFYFVLGVFACLFIHYYILPYLSKWKVEEALGDFFIKASFLCSTVALYFIAFTTFNITEDVWNNKIQPVLYILVVFIFIPVAIKIYRLIKERINEPEEDNKDNNNN